MVKLFLCQRFADKDTIIFHVLRFYIEKNAGRKSFPAQYADVFPANVGSIPCM